MAHNLRKNAANTIVIFVLILVAGTNAAAQEIRIVFGNLHAHSNASDGNKNTSPADAYRIAREEGGLDFLSLSEHNHIMKDQAVYDGVIAAANAETTADFVALYGQEFSTLSLGNHVNVQNYPVRIAPSLNGQFDTLFGMVLPIYDSLNADALIVAELNHPAKFEKDYGLESNFGGEIEEFVRVMDPYAQLIAVASGPADVNKKNFVPTPGQRHKHQNISTARWFKYLSYGMHLAPKMDHDNHSPTFGFRHAGRTAVWIRGDFNRESLLKALAARHAYATEDKNLRIFAGLNNGNFPGDVNCNIGDGTLSLTVSVSDDDEPSAAYQLHLYQGIAGDAQYPAKVSGASQSLSGSGSAAFTLQGEPDASLYFIVHVEQISPDPVSGSNKDDAWIAPIWIRTCPELDDCCAEDDEASPAVYVSSRNSKVYHHANCRVVAQIAEHNLVDHGVEPPPGKRLHIGCPLE